MGQYDFKPLIDFMTDDITLIELSNSLSCIFMRFTEMRIDHPDTICTDDAEHLYFLRRVIESLNEIINKQQ